MTLKNRALMIAALAGTMAATTASGEILLFEVNSANPLAAFYIDTASLKPYAQAPGDASRYYVTDGNFSGIPGFNSSVNYAANVTFYTTSGGGGFQIEDVFGRSDPNVEKIVLDALGSSVFDETQGSTADPVFKLGKSLFTCNGNAGQSFDCNLTISVKQAPVSPIPEPASWAMMLVGFGAIGAVFRRRSIMVTTQIA